LKRQGRQEAPRTEREFIDRVCLFLSWRFLAPLALQ
jgi:hypothetical protein